MSRARSSDKAFPDEEPEFQVAPMIDILLVLMTFFMSITSTEVLKTKTKLDLTLPVATKSKPSDTAPSQVIINLSWNPMKKVGGIEFEEKFLDNPEDLNPIIVARKGTKAFFRAVIRADEKVPYSFVQRVMSTCAAAGVDNITFGVLSQESANKKTYKPTPK